MHFIKLLMALVVILQHYLLHKGVDGVTNAMSLLYGSFLLACCFRDMIFNLLWYFVLRADEELVKGIEKVVNDGIRSVEHTLLYPIKVTMSKILLIATWSLHLQEQSSPSKTLDHKFYIENAIYWKIKWLHNIKGSGPMPDVDSLLTSRGWYRRG